jgi:hypothetical protein
LCKNGKASFQNQLELKKKKIYNLKSNYLGTSFVKNDFDIENSTKFLEKKKMEGNEII